MLEGLKNGLINFFFPENCIVCSKNGDTICESCFLKIPRQVFCNGNTLSVYSFKNDIVNRLLWSLKYHNTGSCAKYFGRVMREELSNFLSRNNLQQKNIFLIPIPLNHGDKRLHNHAKLLANSMTGDFLILDILVKNSKQKQAHTHSREERFENIKNVFSISLPKNFQHNPNNLYTIIDDVTTTGATISEARKTLSNVLKINEKEILALTVAH